MSPQVKQLRALIAQLQATRDMKPVETLLREICKGVAEAAPVDGLISLALFVADMGEKAAKDQAMSN